MCSQCEPSRANSNEEARLQGQMLTIAEISKKKSSKYAPDTLQRADASNNTDLVLQLSAALTVPEMFLYVLKSGESLLITFIS